MKRILFGALAAFILLTGCEFPVSNVVSGTHSGCMGDTRASGDDELTEQLCLKATTQGLVMKHLNGRFNCAIKTLELTVTSEKEGNVIRVQASVPDLANCICRVAEVNIVVEGLSEGEEYTLYYQYYRGIQFKFTKHLDLTLNLEDYDPYN